MDHHSIDYSSVQADKHIGTLIGQMYMERSPAVTQLASKAYAEFAVQIREQFRWLTEKISVEFQDEDPYADATEMFRDVAVNRRLKVYRTAPDQRHPLLSNPCNNYFRAVHDFYGHFQTGRGFDRHGEEAAWIRHSQMFSGLARRAMTTETRGQNSAMVWVNGGEFPPQKAVLLPEWVTEVPAQYR